MSMTALGTTAPARRRVLDWARGQRYHGPVYVVNDYDRCDLRRPPYGYRWQRDDRGNLLLVAIATGIIADLVINN
ncbi:hypothetical protein XOCgx_4140 [Xanthomonas oryzae pv. oryzicola]|nr:hypothetical protein XOCgx_4140 [Xanthomonas oryzae pv. oryzicola]